MVKEDLAKIARQKQVEAYKRHEIAKNLRDAWTQQKLQKDSETAVESVFK